MTGLRVALAGCGDISVQHLDAIAAAADVELVALCDSDPARLTLATANRNVSGYGDFEQMLDQQRPDVVHICTPHFRHAPMAIAALRRDVNVLLEKPVATTVADGQDVVRAAAASAAIIGVCYQNRYNTTAQALRTLVERGTLGSLRGGRATVNWFRDNAYYARRPWRGTWAEGGGGVLINQSIHTLDLLQWLLGEVHEVRGQAGRLVLADPVEVEDTATIQLHHADGIGSIFYASNGYAANAPVLLELLGEHGSVRLDDDLVLTAADGTRTTIAQDVAATGEKSYWGLSHGRLIDDFYTHVRAGRPFWIDPAEALKTLRIVTAVYTQSGLGPTPAGREPDAARVRALE